MLHIVALVTGIWNINSRIHGLGERSFDLEWIMDPHGWFLFGFLYGTPGKDNPENQTLKSIDQKGRAPRGWVLPDKGGSCTRSF